jgi:hypothetical protein
MGEMVAEKNLNDLFDTIKKDYPQHHPEYNKEDWIEYFKKQIALANNWGIETFSNQFLYVIATLEYPQHFFNETPQWMKEEMEWPEREEDDKMVILFKELIKRSPETINTNRE